MENDAPVVGKDAPTANSEHLITILVYDFWECP